MKVKPRRLLSTAAFHSLIQIYRLLPALCRATQALPLPKEIFFVDLRFDDPFTAVTLDKPPSSPLPSAPPLLAQGSAFTWKRI